MKDELVVLLETHQQLFKSVVPFKPGIDKLLRLDFTEQNSSLTDELLQNTNLFSNYINQTLSSAGALYGIGGYAEHRTVYNRSKVFDAATAGEEPRRLHLGTDIWGKPNTAVMAPLNGIVHSFAFNNQFGDYGATIILSHNLESQSFYTLYGHLSLHSIQNLSEGDNIKAGDVFAEFGIPYENGHWPPHLHFQIIKEINDWKGDYPGVCRYSERVKWLKNSPDPDLILQLNRYPEEI